MSDHERTELAYSFFYEKEATSQQFSLDELEKITGWKPSTIETYLRKNWKEFITGPVDNLYRCNGICKMSRDEFIELQTQTHSNRSW